MNFLSLIETKRDGSALTPQQLTGIITACVAGEIPDYQLSAFLMAVFFRGLNATETRALTLAMRHLGMLNDKLEISKRPHVRVVDQTGRKKT